MTDIPSLVKTAEQYIILGECKKAEKILRKVAKTIYPHPEVHYLLGEALCMLNRFEEALKELELADTLLPDNPSILHLLGWTVFMNGNPKKGRQILLRVLQQKSSDVSLLCDLAVLENQQGNIDKAKNYAFQALEVDPHNSQAQEVFQMVSRFSRLRENLKKKKQVN